MKEANKIIYMYYVHILVQHKINLLFSPHTLKLQKTLCGRTRRLFHTLSKFEFDIIHGFVRQTGHAVRVPHFYLI